MGTITGTKITERAQAILQDSTGVRWPAATELLGWLNDAQREVVVYKTNACVKRTAKQMDAGTRQTLPVDAVQLIDLPRNMGADGLVPGRAIRITSREILDAQNPDWHTASPNAVARHYTYTSLEPKAFYIYPPQPAAGRGFVEVIYGAIPTDLPSLASVIDVDDIYANVLVDYILYRAFSKDSEVADINRASLHQNAYLAALTGKLRMEAVSNPNTTAPAHPARQGA